MALERERGAELDADPTLAVSREDTSAELMAEYG